MITETSRSAFECIQPKITRSQRAVYRVVLEHPEGLTNAELAHYPQWTINRVTPRANELRKMGVLYDAGIRRCRVTHSPAQGEDDGAAAGI